MVKPLACLYCTLMASLALAGAVPEDREAAYQQYLDYQQMIHGGRVAANWLPDGSTFWYEDGGPNDRRILKVDPAENTVEPLFDSARLRAALTEALGHEPAGGGVPFARFQMAGPGTVSFALEGANFTLDLETYAVTRQLPPASFSIELVKSEAERAVPGTYLRERFQGLGPIPSPEAMSPDGKWIATVRNNNLALRATIDGQEVPVTDDGTDAVFWDVEAALWQPWSPTGEQIAVIKQHADGMPTIPTIKWLKPLEEVREVITIPAGANLYRSELYLLDIHAREPRHVDMGDNTDHYLRVFTWLPDGSELIVARYDRVLSSVELLAVDAVTRDVRTVMTESSETFLTNHHEAIWAAETGFFLLPDGSGFIWNSERSGWDHLYHYDMDGRLVRQLTSGDWPVKDVVRIDQENGLVYFTGHGDRSRPYDTHLYRVGLDGRGFAQLTEGKGQHSADISPSADYFVDTFSNVDAPPRTELRRADGALVRVLGEADIGRLERFGWVAPREQVVKAADGETDLWVTVYFPNDFDAEKKYPVVEYIYAGPQTVWRPMDFGDDLGPFGALLGRMVNFSRALAQLGFLVVILDGRGTPERSKAFHDTIYMNWGQFEIDDHAGAIRQLGERLPYMDLDRVGVMGASWGGHYAFRAMTQAPDLYKVGIAEVPGYSSRRFTLYEVYLGMPQENKAAYDAADAMALAPLLEGELLQTGGINDTGTQADLFQMSEHLIRLGKQHRMMVYPNTGHGMMGKTGEYNMELKKRFLVEMLRPFE